METDKTTIHISFLDMESSSIKPELTVIYFQKLGDDCQYFSELVLQRTLILLRPEKKETQE